MTTLNPFALLGDDENGDPADLITRAVAAAFVKDVKKTLLPQAVVAPAKLPTKPTPPAQAVRDSRGEGGRGRGGSRGGGRGNYANRERGYEGGYSRLPKEGGSQGGPGDSNDWNYRSGGEYKGGRGSNSRVENGDFIGPKDNGEGRLAHEGGRGLGRGRGRGYFNGEEQYGRRAYDRKSGSGRGSEVKRDGAGRGNWGAELDRSGVQEVLEGNAVDEKPVFDSVEKKAEEGAEPESGEKKEAEEEDKEMTLQEYEKLLVEKRKGLQSLKGEERKVTLDKAFESMQLVDKKNDEEVFLKLGTDKGKKKDLGDKEERSKKSLNINEFLRPAEGEAFSSRRGRRGRGQGERGSSWGGSGGAYNSVSAPRIEDPGQFPTLGGK